MTVLPATTDAFCDALAGTLALDAPALATRWQERAAAAAPRPVDAGGTAADAEGVVRAVIASLRKDARCLGEVMRLGWTAGAAAHPAGLAPHHVLSDADLLVAVVMAAAEQCVGQSAESLPPATAADGIAAARRLQRAGALYGHAAAASFLHAVVSGVRAHYRVLRHDLRNPIGTIRGALSLMEDETVPLESRVGPNVRAMVARNAVSLDRLIAAGLDDVAAEALLTVPREVSLRDLALATRRGLREPARLADCDVVVGDDLPAARVDAVAVELTLSALLLAGIAHAGPGDVLRVGATRARETEGGEGASGRSASVTLCVSHDARVARAGADCWDVQGLELAASVVAEFGGRLSAEPPADAAARRGGRRATPAAPAALATAATLYVELPAARTPAPAGGASRPAATSARHQRDDLARAD